MLQGTLVGLYDIRSSVLYTRPVGTKSQTENDTELLAREVVGGVWVLCSEPHFGLCLVAERPPSVTIDQVRSPFERGARFANQVYLYSQ